MSLYRDTYALINLRHLQYNVEKTYEKAQLPFMAIIKADAYGHGYQEVAMHLQPMECISMFGVATLKEALDLRKLGVTKEILVLGAIPVDAEDVLLAATHDISLTIFSLDYILKIKQYVNHQRIKIHIKLDTGMNRIGIKTEAELQQVLQETKSNSFIIEGVFTHFASADGEEKGYNMQLQRFINMIGNRNFKYVHCNNSAGMVYHQNVISNLGRLGIVMYGCDPTGEDTDVYKQVMSLYTKVAMIKKVSKGERVGYGFTYTTPEDCYIATLPIGYADGFIRKNQGRNVYVNGKYYPIVGRVCMDQVMIKVDDSVKVDDVVEIFGEHISLASMAKDLDTIPYEVMCLISKRVERIYEK